MHREPLGVWSPHRDSHSVLAFKSLLSLRPERWIWQPGPAEASWWVVDGTRESIAEWTAALHQEKTHATVRGALLAPEWSAVKDPVWSFFKVPLQVNQVYRWIEAHQQPPKRPELAFEGQRLQLRRWPNMSRYTASSPMSHSLPLTVACARLLQEPVDYAQAQKLVQDVTLLDTLLSDALHDGILELTPTQAPPLATTTPDTPPAAATVRPDDRGTWSLVKRLIRKFT